MYRQTSCQKIRSPFHPPDGNLREHQANECHDQVDGCGVADEIIRLHAFAKISGVEHFHAIDQRKQRDEVFVLLWHQINRQKCARKRQH